MNNNLLVASDALRLTATSLKRRIFPSKKYSGSAEEICRGILDDCFEKRKKYFRVSPHNFRQFYARDFGMCCESLIKTGYKKQAHQTIEYAMDIYSKYGKITTQITPNGKPADFPSHTPESASYMLNSIILLGDKKLLKRYSSFFFKIAKDIYMNDIEQKTGLLRRDMHFSSMKDYSLRESDCYNNCFLALFAENLRKSGIKTPLEKYDYKKIIRKNFIRIDAKKRKYFAEDLSGKDIFSGDANVFPFWTKLYDAEKEKNLLSGINSIIAEKKMDAPWPLKYTTKEDAPKKMHAADILVPGYEKDNLWMHLGLCYMKILEGADDRLLHRYTKKIEELILRHKTFYEVYESDGRVFSRLLYKSDEAMLWCSIFLDLYLEQKKSKRIKA